MFFGNLYFDDNIKKPLRDNIYLRIKIPIKKGKYSYWTIKVNAIFGDYDFVYFDFLSDLAPKNLIEFGDNLNLYSGERRVATVVIRN